MNYVQRRRFLWAVFLIGLLAVAIAANATTLVRLTLPQLVRQSTAIVRAHCEGSHVVFQAGEIWTDNTFQIIETHKGFLPARIVARRFVPVKTRFYFCGEAARGLSPCWAGRREHFEFIEAC